MSTLVDCCFWWVLQHLQAFSILLAAYHHHIVVLPSSLSNCIHPIPVLKSPPSSSLTSPPLAAAVESSTWPSQSCRCQCCLRHCYCPHHRWCHFKDAALLLSSSSCFLAANRRSWTKPLLPKLSAFVDCCLGWVVQTLQVFCMLLPPITIPSSLSHCCCPITDIQLPSLNRRRCCHWHRCRRRRQRRHCRCRCHCRCCCHCHLRHHHHCHHCRRCFLNVALSLLSKWGGGKFPFYLS